MITRSASRGFPVIQLKRAKRKKRPTPTPGYDAGTPPHPSHPNLIAA
jgi:hypothetical protein